MRSSPCNAPGEHVTSDGSKNKQRPPIGAASISPNGHFSFVPENDKLAVARTQMSTAPISFVCPPAPEIGAIFTPSPRDRGHFYNGSWPFRENKDGPPTRILSNCCNRVTPHRRLLAKGPQKIGSACGRAKSGGGSSVKGATAIYLSRPLPTNFGRPPSPACWTTLWTQSAPTRPAFQAQSPLGRA
jgi:hypothetical protein